MQTTNWANEGKEEQGHFLTLAPGHLHMKFKTFFFVETTWPVLTKEMKICESDAGHMAKMAATPIYGKTSKIFFSWTGWPISTKLGM